MTNIHTYCFLCFFLLLGGFQLRAQAPCFAADDTVGCVPFTVNFTSCTDLSKPIAFDFGDGSGPQFADPTTGEVSHEYTSAGFYTVTQFVGNPGNIQTEEKEDYIAVLGSPDPVFEVVSCANRNIVLYLTDTTYDEYYIDFGEGNIPLNTTSPATIPHTYSDTIAKTIVVTGAYNEAPCTGDSSKTIVLYNQLITPDIITLQANQSDDANVELTLTANLVDYLPYSLFIKEGDAAPFIVDQQITPENGLNTFNFNPDFIDFTYGIRIQTADSCGNERNADVYSQLVFAAAQNNQNLITWTEYQGADLQEYRLYRNNTLLTTSSDTSYLDLDITCTENYCYYVEAILTTITASGNAIVSKSGEKCVVAFSTDTPEPIDTLLGTIRNEKTFLHWSIPVPHVDRYDLYTSTNGGSFLFDKSFQTSDSLLNNGNWTDDECYKLLYQTVCNTNQPDLTISAETCPVYLSLDNSVPMQITLNWNAYTGYPISNYVVERLDDQNNVISSTDVGMLLTYTATNTDTVTTILRYRIRVEGSDTRPFDSYSNIAVLEDDGILFFPTAFSPNGDGLNDFYLPVGRFIETFEMRIFNRWGELLYYTDSMTEGWNGGLNNSEPLEPDVYVYMATFTDSQGVKREERGTFTLVR